MWSTDQGVVYLCTSPPMTDQLTISHYNINTISSRQVMGIKKLIGILEHCWSKTKFSELPSQELYGRQ